MAPAAKPAPSADAQAERDFFEVAQRESLAAEAMQSESRSHSEINLESGLPSLESGLVTLESGLFSLSDSGSFEFPDQSNVLELNSGMLDADEVESSLGGVTNAINKFEVSKPLPPPVPPRKQLAEPLAAPQLQGVEPLPAPPVQRQVITNPPGLARSKPRTGRAPNHRREPTRSSESFPPRVASMIGSRPMAQPHSDGPDTGGRYTSKTIDNERVAARPLKIKIRQD
ncbi:MAG: hypothetical protein ACJAYU_000811 [Bradymonadia bacterium]|jgi:hypothetical protein